jgi:peptide/nickel transport system substrate-binding protein
MRPFGGALAAALCLGALLADDAPAAAASYSESPMLGVQVSAGALPPVDQRLPEHPAVADMAFEGQTIGRYGGDMAMLMASAKDTRIMNVYGYARLVGYDRDLNIVPDLCESFEVEGERIFTFHLRPGHKWSDGSPFTTEYFRYYW